MKAFIDECRREWKRLRVPRAVADEMAGELEADLRAAADDGVPAHVLLGVEEHNPRGLARAWAIERGVARPRVRARLSVTTSSVAAAILSVILVGLSVLVTLVVTHRDGTPDVTRTAASRASYAYGVFAGKRDSTALPHQALRLARALIVADPRLPATMRTGAMLRGSGRILLVSPATLGRNVYGFATTSGRACELIPGLLAGCDRGQVQTTPIAWMSGGRVGGPGIITGLARDGVGGVDVLLPGGTQPTTLKNNAFYVELPLTEMRSVRGLRVTMQDGSTTDVKVSGLG
jgi:hypothetical protein